jgi:hypothetical protein
MHRTKAARMPGSRGRGIDARNNGRPQRKISSLRDVAAPSSPEHLSCNSASNRLSRDRSIGIVWLGAAPQHGSNGHGLAILLIAIIAIIIFDVLAGASARLARLDR